MKNILDLPMPVYVSVGFDDERLPETGIIMVVDDVLLSECLLTDFGIYEFDDQGIAHLIAVNTKITNLEEFIMSDFNELITYGKSVPAGKII